MLATRPDITPVAFCHARPVPTNSAQLHNACRPPAVVVRPGMCMVTLWMLQDVDIHFCYTPYLWPSLMLEAPLHQQLISLQLLCSIEEAINEVVGPAGVEGPLQCLDSRCCATVAVTNIKPPNISQQRPHHARGKPCQAHPNLLELNRFKCYSPSTGHRTDKP